MYNIGTKDDSGAYSGSRKYRLIEDYVMYGHVDDKNITKENDEMIDIKFTTEEITCLHLPHTLIPCEGDRVTLAINQNKIIYRITKAEPTTFNNKPYYRTTMIIDQNLPSIDYNIDNMKSQGLITNTFVFNQGSIGTHYSPIIKKANVNSIAKIEDLRADIQEMYNDNFYDVNRNIFVVS